MNKVCQLSYSTCPWDFLEVLTLVCREYLVNLESSIVVVTQCFHILLRNYGISNVMMNYQTSMMANPWSPFYMLPIFYEGLHKVAPVATWLCHIQCLLVAGCSVLLSAWLLLQCISKVVPTFNVAHQFCTPRLLWIVTWNNGSPVDFLWISTLGAHW